LFADESVFKSTSSNQVASPDPEGFSFRENSGNTALLFDNDGFYYIQSLNSLDDYVIPLHYNSIRDLPEKVLLGAETINGINHVIWRFRDNGYLHPWKMDENWRFITGEEEAFTNSEKCFELEREFQQDFYADGKISTPPKLTSSPTLTPTSAPTAAEFIGETFKVG
jgi:hypothetical protein